MGQAGNMACGDTVNPSLGGTLAEKSQCEDPSAPRSQLCDSRLDCFCCTAFGCKLGDDRTGVKSPSCQVGAVCAECPHASSRILLAGVVPAPQTGRIEGSKRNLGRNQRITGRHG